MTSTTDPVERENAAEPPGDASAGSAMELEKAREKIRVLERHIDHLMGQLYHQVGLLHQQRDQVAHFAKQLHSIEGTPRLLDQSLQKIAQLKEDLAGRKEVELDLRRRIDDLEREERVKQQHILKLETYLGKIWYSPHRRLLRSLKNTARGLFGRGPSAPQARDSDDGPP